MTDRIDRSAGRHRPGEPGLNRRTLLKAAAGTGAALVLPGCLQDLIFDFGLQSATAILRARYDNDLAGVIERGFSLVPPPDVAGRRVLLKINLVDLPRDGKPVTTDPAVVIAAVEAFRRRGAAEVIVADGPGLQRDTWDIVDAIGLTPLLRQHAIPFIDLNTADVSRQPNAHRATGLDHLYFARPAWEADVLVSMPKMKAHHGLGVSLAMKNLFGTLSGIAYGTPRNIFHLRNAHSAVLDFNHTRPADYAIVDGVTGMEGDGPVRGTPIDVGVLVMGDNLPAVDATAARIMGVRPERIDYLRGAAGILGPITEANIEQRGEAIADVRTPFRLLPGQTGLML